MKKVFLFSTFILLAMLSSCGFVYSLFPIYTKDTIVEKKEIIGKWVSQSDSNDYISIWRLEYDVEISQKAKVESNDDIAVDRFSITVDSDDPNDIVEDRGDYVLVNGDTIVFADSIKMDFEEAFAEIRKKAAETKALPVEIKKSTKLEESGYIMEYHDKDGQLGSFVMTMVNIQGDLFMDLYPSELSEETNRRLEKENYFPVHSFMKVNLTDDRLEIKQFSEEKLKELFKSNRIRMRHEIVDDKVLITAQPKEIQKFLSSYSTDESVFSTPDKYVKVKP